MIKIMTIIVIGSLQAHLENEVFFLLFGNRSLLAALNQYVSGVVSRIKPDDVADEFRVHLAGTGVLRRVAIPEWVRRAVYHRDRGRCVVCNCDLTGLITLQSEDHFDHIIPLRLGGLNDVTNIQLLCGPCNLKKGHKVVGISNKYERWY